VAVTDTTPIAYVIVLAGMIVSIRVLDTPVIGYVVAITSVLIPLLFILAEDDTSQ